MILPNSHNKPIMATRTPLSTIALAFDDLSQSLECRAKEEGFRLDELCHACSLVSVLFNSLGLAFRFAEMEYVAKVGNLAEASRRFGTIENILDVDVANGTVKKQRSHSRDLRRVRQGLDLIRALFEEFLSSKDYSLRNAASTAYAQVCAPYHTWAVRTAVSAGMHTLPTREQLLQKLNETDHSAKNKMKRYIRASGQVIDYIDKLYISRKISLDW
ncbi:ACD11-like protein [Hibiscus syriacus]|uniref:ACD11-like protein n=1 Tax=Hibiscus syriacus TaxID=106335 RepID=A0A6A2XG62_HIBSY|nr:ACD11 homolog protein-like [Hibiscus syriacus]KAE8657449.1 ACD11-like protein [Hibiscus syriacus]